MKKNWLFLLFLLVTPVIYFSCSSSSTPTALVGNWSQVGDFAGVARYGAVSFTIGDTVYVGLGYNQINSPRYFKDFYRYDYKTSEWKAIKPFGGIGRSDAVAFSVNGRGYVGTGYNGDLDANNYLNDFWEYNPATDTWNKVGHLPAERIDSSILGRRNAVAFAIGNNGYVGTGYSGKDLSDFWKFTPNTDTSLCWTEIANMPYKRANAVSFVINDMGYVVTGDNSGTYVDRFYRYNPVTQAWEELRRIANVSTDTYDDSYNIVRSNAVALVMQTGTQTKAYVTCGGSPTGSTRADTWEYDPSTDLWIQKTSFEATPRWKTIGFSVGNRIFVTTGGSGSQYFGDIWEFKPNDAYDAVN